MAEDDLVYLLRRAAEERAKALESRQGKARAIHSSLAQAYGDRARCQAQPEGDDQDND